jgi:hypothetical protein
MPPAAKLPVARLSLAPVLSIPPRRAGCLGTGLRSGSEQGD